MTMRRGVLIALTVLSLAGCTATQTSEARLNSVVDRPTPHCRGQISATM